jgi:hypothetical protein
MPILEEYITFVFNTLAEIWHLRGLDKIWPKPSFCTIYGATACVRKEPHRLHTESRFCCRLDRETLPYRDKKLYFALPTLYFFKFSGVFG